jgi:hypothetical protein
MLFRVLDNKDGAILALVFDEETAKHILKMFPEDARVPGDEETIRYVYEDCFQNGPREADQVGDSLAQLGRHIQSGNRRLNWNEVLRSSKD